MDRYKLLLPYLQKYYELASIRDRSITYEALPPLYESLPPLNVYVEPTNMCNLNCSYCARENMTRDTGFMSLDNFKRIIDGNILPTITITGQGEPLLNTSIYEMIKYGNNSNCRVVTNGTTLVESNAIKLLSSGLAGIQISFDSMNKETFEQNRFPAKFEETLLKVLKFIKLSIDMKSNIYISIISVQTDQVKKDIESSIYFWDSLPIDNFYQSPLFSLQTDSKCFVPKNVTEPWQFCVDPWIVSRISYNGDVTLCPQDFSNKYVIGNVYNCTFKELFNNDKAKAFRKALLNYDIEFFKNIGYNCHQCNSWQMGGGVGVNEFLNFTLPARMVLVIRKVIDKVYQEYKLKNLNLVIYGLENGIPILDIMGSVKHD